MLGNHWVCAPGNDKTNYPINKITTTKIKRNNELTKQIEETWGPALSKEKEILEQVLRCERVIQEKHLSEEEIRTRWYCAINERLTIDKVTTTKIRRNSTQYLYKTN